MGFWLELAASGLITGGIYALVALGLNLQYGLMRIMNISHGEFLMLGAYLTWLAYTVFGINPVASLPGVAIGLNLQYGLMRIMNISHGEFLMLGAFLTWGAHTAWGISPLVFLPAAFAVLMLIGIAVHWLCFRQVAARAPSVEVFEARSLMVGFGLMFFVQNTALLIWGGDLRGYDYLAEPVQIADMRFTVNKLVLFGIALALSLVLIALLRLTLLGKAVRALMQSPVGAQLVGINTKRLHPLSSASASGSRAWPAHCCR